MKEAEKGDKVKKEKNEIKPFKQTIKLVLNSKEDTIKTIGKQYIDLKKICDLMKLFNPKTPVHAKIRCIN